LSGQARAHAVKCARPSFDGHDYHFWTDAYNSLTTFCNEFGVEIRDYAVTPHSASYVRTDASNKNFRDKSLSRYARDDMPTGYIADCPLWETFHDEWTHTTDPHYAFNAALAAWVKHVREDMEYQESDEYIAEALTSDDNVWYTVEGRRYEYD